MGTSDFVLDGLPPAAVRPADEDAMREARRRWDSVAKPLGSLGLLEDFVVKIAGLTGSADVDIGKRAVVVLCADNGVVKEGVSQSGGEVTMLVAENLTRGLTSVCRMAAVAGADVIPVDMGMLSRPLFDGLIDCHVADGTKNIAEGPAMTRAEAESAVTRGVGLARLCRERGYRLIATGEMGIGNTTTSSAIASVLLGVPPVSVTGRGAGLPDAALIHKIVVVERAIAVNRPDPGDALDVLGKLGGFDIAGLAGVFLGGAIYRVPVLIDGLISAVGALIAARLCPGASCAMLPSHRSGESACGAVLSALGLTPVIDAGMRLGEGTGAVAAIPLLDMALSVYHGSSSFSDIGIEPYESFV
ncbi:MAG: nicotinate-nucleotide--dimethylbenzimidazole phosphoribosyltransferase [Oscillospiraceae bacterium]|jgi:nicotinate-nucleotide--dimethylbenzimidazole phosphoribosyltransferase|nr:nicotinate-nucleotide--dimethylbenzimidazole phosphoribosyltransferase [Oscillospiraceae bacterium]